AVLDKPHKHLGLYDRTISSLCVYFAPLLLLPSGQCQLLINFKNLAPILGHPPPLGTVREALITLIQKLYIIIAREVTYSRWLGPIASRKDPSCRWIAHLTICHILPYTTPPPSSIPCQLQLHQSWEQPEEKSRSRPLYRLKLGIFNARGPSSSIAAFRPSCADGVERFQLPTKLKQEYEYCHSLFGQRMVPHDRLVNFKPVILPLATSFFLLWLCAVSLPQKGALPVVLRLSLLPFLLASAFDITVNKSYSLGSPLRDVMFPYWGCLIAFRIIDMALVSLWDENPAPMWIKPQYVPEQHNLHVSKSITSSERIDEKDVEEASPAPFHEGKGICKETCETSYLWRPVAHSPLFSFDRALYGLDVLLLNRPGTPWLFPWRLRSLDWSLVALNGQRREQLKFGKPEWPFLLALIQQVFHLMAHNFIRSMDLDGKRSEARDLWVIKLSDQILVTLALGAIVALSSSLEEAITFPLLLNSKFLPQTALLGNTRRAILSKGLVELWGYRWHHNWRRSFVRTARLFPGGLNPTGNALWTFFLRYLEPQSTFTISTLGRVSSLTRCFHRHDALYHACASLPDANSQPSLYDFASFLGTWDDVIFRRTRSRHNGGKDVLSSEELLDFKTNLDVRGLDRYWAVPRQLDGGQRLAISLRVESDELWQCHL
ncbi:hypothetical protein PSHT_15114, partial [Puccinia striiformis]